MSLCLLVWLVGTPHSSACAPGPGPYPGGASVSWPWALCGAQARPSAQALLEGRLCRSAWRFLSEAVPSPRLHPLSRTCLAPWALPVPSLRNRRPRCPVRSVVRSARFHVDAAFRRAHVGSLPACPSRRQRPRPKPPAGCARGRLASSPFLLRHRLLWASRGRGLSPSSYHLLSVWLTLPGQPSLAPRHGTRRRPRPPALPSLLPRSRTPVRPTLTPQPTARPRAVRALARLQG